MDIDIREIEIRDLRPNSGEVEGLPRNPRKISKEQLARLKNSLMGAPEMLRLRELIVVPHGDGYVVIAGNQRLEAAKAVGMTALPCKVLPADTDPAKLREYAIKDNMPFGEDDWEVIASDWDKTELEEWGMSVPEEWKDTKKAEEDDFDPDSVTETVCKNGDIWQLGDHRLMCGDSTDANDVAVLMDGAKADMVFTDPPYNINYGNIKHPKFKVRHIENDNMDKEKFYNFCVDFCHSIKSVCDGVIYICAGQGEDGRIMFSVADNVFHNSTTIIWNKDVFTLGRGKYQNKYEPIWFGWSVNGNTFCDDRTLSNVWDIARPKKSELHPTMKPIELVATALIHNPKGLSVLDLFGGSGTTLIAAEQLNRKCYMMELDPHYCDVIIARWEKLTGKKATKIN